MPDEDRVIIAGIAIAAAGVGLYMVSQLLKPPPDGGDGDTTQPVASFVATPTAPRVGDVVTFDGSASRPSQGASIVSYGWDFGDGQSGSGSSVTHAYAAGGTYTVRLTVTDSASKTASTIRALTVTAPVVLTGIAVDGATFAPLSGIVLRLRGLTDPAITYGVGSGGDGRFEFRDIVPQLYLFIADDPDWILQGSPNGQTVDGRFSHPLGINGSVYMERYTPTTVRIIAPQTVDVSTETICCNYPFLPYHNHATHPNGRIPIVVEVFDQFGDLFRNGFARVEIRSDAPNDGLLECPPMDERIGPPNSIWKSVVGRTLNGQIGTRYWATTNAGIFRNLTIEVTGFWDSKGVLIQLPVRIVSIHTMQTKTGLIGNRTCYWACEFRVFKDDECLLRDGGLPP